MANHALSFGGNVALRLVASGGKPVPEELINQLEDDLKKADNSFRGQTWQRRLLVWLREQVHPEIPALYYKMVLGGDKPQFTIRARLRARLQKVGSDEWVHPYSGIWLPSQRYAVTISNKKVTQNFRDDVVDVLTANVTQHGLFDDYKFHEIGLSATAEANTQTNLITPTGIARQTGTQLEGATADIYRSVATTTADATETWNEHGLFNHTSADPPTSGARMMDRSVFAAGISVVASDTLETTYELTVNEEP